MTLIPELNHNLLQVNNFISSINYFISSSFKWCSLIHVPFIWHTQKLLLRICFNKIRYFK